MSHSSHNWWLIDILDTLRLDQQNQPIKDHDNHSMTLTEKKKKVTDSIAFLIAVVGNAVSSQTRIVPRPRAGKKPQQQS